MPLTRFGKWTLATGVLSFEVAGFYISYRIWSNCNNSQDYRKMLYHTHPNILDAFYISCQLAGVYFPKEKDLRDWGIQEDRKK